MPAFQIAIDGEDLATVSTDGLRVLAVHLRGNRSDDAFVTVRLDGTTTESESLTWLHDLEIRTAQTVTLRFLETSETSARGKTIDELYPDDEEDVDEAGDGESDEELSPTAMLADLQARPLLRDGYGLKLQLAEGQSVESRTTAEEHGFGLTVLWNQMRPERVSVALSCHTLEQAVHRSPSRELARDYVSAPGEIRLQVRGPCLA